MQITIKKQNKSHYLKALYNGGVTFLRPGSVVTFSKSHVCTFGKNSVDNWVTWNFQNPFFRFWLYKLSEVAWRFIIHQTLVTQPHMISNPKNSVNYVLAICLQPPGNTDALLNLPRLESEQKWRSRVAAITEDRVVTSPRALRHVEDRLSNYWGGHKWTVQNMGPLTYVQFLNL